MTTVTREFRQLARYGLVGLISNLGLYALFLVLLRVGVRPTAATGICYALGVTASYLANRRWTFSSARKHSSDLPKFVIAYGIGLISTLATINLLMRWLRPEFAQLFNIAITAAVIYAGLKIFRFGQEDRKDAD